MTYEQLDELDEDELKRRLSNQFALMDDEIKVLFADKDALIHGYIDRVKLVRRKSPVKAEDHLGYESGVDAYEPSGLAASEADALLAKENARKLKRSIAATGSGLSVEDIKAAQEALALPSAKTLKKTVSAKALKKKG